MTTRLALLRNMAMLSIASYAELAFGLLLGVVIARSLGSSAFGHYAFAVWVTGTLVTLSNNALTMSSIRYIAEARGAADLEVAAAIAARMRRWQVASSILVLGTFSVAVAVHTPQDWQDSIGWMLPLILLGAWSRSGYMMLASIGKGHERFEVESVSLVLSALVNLILVSLLAWVGGSIVGYFAIFAICGLVQNLSARILIRRFGIVTALAPLAPALDRRVKRHVLQTGALVVIGLLGDRTIEVLMLKAYWTSEAVGFFAIAGALTKGATYLLAGALSSVLLPAMARAYGAGGRRAVARILPEAMRFYWFIGIAIAGLGLVAAPGAVSLLYGPQYREAIPAIVVNLVIAGFVLVSAAFNAFQTSSDRQGDRIRVALLTLAVNAAVGFTLVPLSGLTGALVSLAVTRIAAVTFAWRYAVRETPIAMPVLEMTRTFYAAVVATGAAKLVDLLLPGVYGFVLSSAVFVAAYLLGSVVFGAWRPSDLDLVCEVLGHIGPRGGQAAAFLRAAATPHAHERSETLGRREMAAQLSRSLGVSTLARAVRSRVVSDLRVLAYHRVLPELDEARFDFDRELVSARRQEFEWQINYVAKLGRPITAHQVSEALDGGPPLPKGATLITFDDGFQDNYSVAYPVLKSYGIEATFFISTGYVGEAEMFWFDWVVHAVLHTPRTRLRVDSLGLQIDLCDDTESRRKAAMILLDRLKRNSEMVRLQVIAELRAGLGVDWNAAPDMPHRPLTWDQVREMSRGGMAFGSHTITHPILSRIADPAVLCNELAGSKVVIERETGRPVLSLAYPVGGADAINAEVLRHTRAAGYRYAFTYESGVNRLNDEARFRMKRLRVERYTSRDMFIAALEMPSVFA